MSPITTTNEVPCREVQQVLDQVDAVKGQVQSNIAGVLDNTEKAGDLVAKSEELREGAEVFRENSRALKKQIQWKHCKMMLILGGLVIGIILAIAVPMIIKAMNE